MNLPEKDLKVEDTYPLSPMQEGMLFDSVSGADPGVNLEQIVCTIPAELDLAAFERAWTKLVARNPILRTRFRWQEVDRPMQEVLFEAPLRVTHENVDGMPELERDRNLSAFLAEDRLRGIDLATAPLMRVHVFIGVKDETQFVWTFHHALIDGRAIIAALKEVMALYENEANGTTSFHFERVPYRAYIDFLETIDDAESRAFFQKELAGVTRVTPLPYATGDVADSFGNDEVETVLPAATVNALRGLAKERDVTLNTMVQAAWAIVLGRHAGEDTVVFGATRAGRHAVPGANTILGLLINTLPMRADVSRGRTLDALLFDLRARWNSMRDHEHTALTTIREVSELRREGSLFESVMVFENYDLEAGLRAEGGLWERAQVRQLEQSSAPLTLAAYAKNELILKVEYSLSHFDRATVERLGKQLTHVLTQMAVQPDATLGDISLLTPDEQHEMLHAWNDTAQSYPSHHTLHTLIEARARTAPDAVAIVDGESSITYRDLDARANQLADRLESLGIIRGAFVALFLPRGIDHIVSMLGVSKTGAAFVPIDPDYPRERIAHLLSDSGASVVLTHELLLTQMPPYEGTTVALDQEREELASRSRSARSTQVTPEDAAYVIYTSGSTGKPKGVVVGHAALVNHITAFTRLYAISDRDRVLHFASTSFDVALEEVFPTLNAGASIVVRPRELMSATAFSDYVDAAALTVLNIPTAYFHEWVAGMAEASLPPPASLRLVVFGGERASIAMVNEWHRLNGGRVRTMNGYGPTEATITCTAYESTEPTKRELPIGKPIANMQAYVLDVDKKPVPIGVAADLYVGGVGLAIGYLGQYELTRAKFIKHPFESGARLYHTGDRARFLPDGNLEFLGRVDHQIKFRGYRMEPAEIQTALEEHSAIRESLVVLRENDNKEKKLIAYLVTNGEAALTPAEMRAHLQTRVPAYMTPTDFVFIDAFPRTTNQKIDLNALPLPGGGEVGGAPQLAPRTPVEEVLQKIWQEVLERSSIGINDNFFDLGGHSLLTLKIIDRAARAGIRITPDQFFQRQTVAELAAVVDLQAVSDDTLITLRGSGTKPPIYFVHSTPGDLFGYMTLIHALGPDQPCYGFQSLGLTHKEQAHSSIEEMAAHYVSRLREFQPQGPYLLAGWCYGGIVSFEMARILREQGETPPVVALIEAAAPRPALNEPGYYLDRLKRLADAGIDGLREVALARLKFRMRLGKPKAADWLGFEVTEGVLKNRAHVFEVNMKAIYKYKPTRYAGPIQVFRCAERMKRSIPDPNLGWTALASSVESHVSTGTHETMLAGDNADALANHLRDLIDRNLS